MPPLFCTSIFVVRERPQVTLNDLVSKRLVVRMGTMVASRIVVSRFDSAGQWR